MARAQVADSGQSKPRYASSSMKQSCSQEGTLLRHTVVSCRCFNLRRGDLWPGPSIAASSFHATTINSPEGAEIFVRSGEVGL